MDGAENRYITISSPSLRSGPQGATLRSAPICSCGGSSCFALLLSLRSGPQGAALRSAPICSCGGSSCFAVSPLTKKQSTPQDYSCKHDSSAALTVFFHCDSSNVCVTCYTLSGFLSSFCLSLSEILLSGIHFQA